ncbi:MAG: hypothetical protein CVV42_03015 [Candidatus Riflebacteria bacterium HGW-Riflebacteria-2]|jgi:hypothetical protein|nr:MAG: hypothetical protein CVV42_03015 [Candidatus Riflebacteria bacterium HGW-Riflebacteria-2]
MLKEKAPSQSSAPEKFNCSNSITSGAAETRFSFFNNIFNSELESVATAPGGTGNSALNTAAMKIAQFHHLGLFDKEPLKQHLTTAYLKRGGSFKNKTEADATFESGWRAGLKSPRTLPDGGWL